MPDPDADAYVVSSIARAQQLSSACGPPGLASRQHHGARGGAALQRSQRCLRGGSPLLAPPTAGSTQARSLCSDARDASGGVDAAHERPRRGSSGLGSRTGRGVETHGGGGRGGGAGRVGERSQRGRARGFRRLGPSGPGAERPAGSLTLKAWLLLHAERVGTANGGALVRLAQDLEGVPAGEAVAASARAVQAVEAILERACACKGVKLPPFLGVFTRALMQHPGLMGRAQQSQRFIQIARALLGQAGACEATYAAPKHVSQLAVAQQRLGIAVPAYWQRLAAAMPPNLGGREVAGVYHAYAALVAQGLQADACLCAELEQLAAATAAVMVPREVALVFGQRQR
jgi:hypothetical protein